VGGINAARRLSQPFRRTLFFAGEATESENSGTVEGALASGLRAFRQIVRARR
jgi:monoamine oxidase